MELRAMGVVLGVIVFLHSVAAAHTVYQRGTTRQGTAVCDEVGCLVSDGAIDYFVGGGTDFLFVCGKTRGELDMGAGVDLPLHEFQPHRESGDLFACAEISPSSISLHGGGSHEIPGLRSSGNGDLDLAEDDTRGFLDLNLFAGTPFETRIEVYGAQGEGCLWALLVPPDQAPVLIDPSSCSP